MTTRRFLQMVGGLSPRVETERARHAQASVRTEVSAEVLADARAFERANRAAADARWSIELGRIDGETSYRVSLDDLLSISAQLTGGTGAGKTKVVCSVLAQLVWLAVGGAPASLIIVDGKGDLADEQMRNLGRVVANLPARTFLASRLRTMRPWDDAWLPSMPLLAPRAGVDATTIGQTLANTLCDVIGDASVGARQRAMLAALLSLAAELDIPFVSLPFLLADLGQLEALAPRATSALHRLELARVAREGQASIDGLSARLNALLHVPSLRACLSGPTPVDWAAMFTPGSVTFIDLGGAPLGAREASRILGSLTISSIVDAAFDASRRVQGRTWIVIDEPAFLTPTSASQLDRVATQGRSFGVATLLVHQGATQLPTELQSSLSTNTAWRAIGRSSARDVDAAAEWFTRMPAPPEVTSDAARRRWFTNLVGTLPARQFLVSDRRAPFAPRRIESLPFDPPAWSSLSADTRTFLRRGVAGFPRAELETRARELELHAEAALLARRTSTTTTTKPLGPKVARRRRGAVP